MWNSRLEWASCYRTELPLRGVNTTNYVEVTFKILKDTVLDRVMAFNVVQLLDFVLTRFEMYVERRLVDIAHGC